MYSLAKAREIHYSNILEFQKACVLYKSMLDKNFGGRFCIGRHCRTIFMVEITMDGRRWGATRNIFYSKKEADQEAAVLRQIYPFISDCRVVTRKQKE